VQREQNSLMVGAYRESMDTPRVSAARRALFEQASIEHAKEIVGFIEGAESHTESVGPEAQREKPRAVWRGNQMVDGRDGDRLPN
jgi:hypothetical protein